MVDEALWPFGAGGHGAIAAAAARTAGIHINGNFDDDVTAQGKKLLDAPSGSFILFAALAGVVRVADGANASRNMNCCAANHAALTVNPAFVRMDSLQPSYRLGRLDLRERTHPDRRRRQYLRYHQNGAVVSRDVLSGATVVENFVRPLIKATPATA